MPRLTDLSDRGLVPDGLSSPPYIKPIEYGQGAFHQTVLSCKDIPLTFTDQAGVGQYASVKLYDFPEGLLLVQGTVLTGSLTLVDASWTDAFTGHVGLSNVAVDDFTDAMGKCGRLVVPIAVTGAAQVAPVSGASTTSRMDESNARWLDGTTTASDLYMNVLIADAAAHVNGATGTFTGTIRLTWVNMGDK